MNQPVSRRYFVRRASAYSLGFAGLNTCLASRTIAQALTTEGSSSFGPLIQDPEGILDLPQHFSYKIISRHGDKMSDGLTTPGLPDGMAAFPIDGSRCAVIRNHEIARGDNVPAAYDGRSDHPDSAHMFDGGHGTPLPGGTTTLIFNTQTQAIEHSFLSLFGSERNCAGGPTPWGSWLTCEETVSKQGKGREHDHGWVFEVPVTESPRLADPTPIRGMGRFNHEAVAISPQGNVYLTEDRGDGLIYRFIPDFPGKLQRGGTLQFLCVKNRPSLVTNNHRVQSIKVGELLDCEWKDVEDVESPDDTMRYEGFERGGAVFARGEGMWAGDDGVYFCCTSGGKTRDGQIFRLRFSEETGPAGAERVQLELFLEPNDASVLQAADNVTVAPNGHLIVCEDGGKREDCLIGVSPDGECYRVAANRLSRSELAGAAFSPDGSTLFVNIQQDGLTLAIRGPWHV